MVPSIFIGVTYGVTQGIAQSAVVKETKPIARYKPYKKPYRMSSRPRTPWKQGSSRKQGPSKSRCGIPVRDGVEHLALKGMRTGWKAFRFAHNVGYTGYRIARTGARAARGLYRAVRGR